MTLDAMDTQLKKFLAALEAIESAGLAKSNFAHMCRQTLEMMEVHITQCRRAITALREGNTDVASRELGDYMVQHSPSSGT